LLDQKIKKTIADFFKINIELVNNDLTVGDIQQWDSLGHIGLITHFEKEFDISIDVDQSLEMESVEDIVEIISEILGE
jgi:Acyl carrier protein